jgi:hypothetical protein
MKGNDSREQVVGSVVRYMGLAILGIAAVNPSKEELMKLLSMEEEPKDTMYTYTGIKSKDAEGGEKETNKVRLWLRGENLVMTDKTDANGNPVIAKEVITVPYDVFCYPRPAISSKGSSLTLNSLGNSTWQSIEKIESNENMSWFSKHKPLREAMEGEAELIEFFRNFLNLGSRDEAGFENYKAIASGNVDELRKYVSRWGATNAVVVLLGAKIDDKGDNKKVYQAVYQKLVSRPSIKNYKDLFVDALNKPYGEFKAEYPSNLKLQYYTSEAEKPDAAPATTPTVGGSWV